MWGSQSQIVGLCISTFQKNQQFFTQIPTGNPELNNMLYTHATIITVDSNRRIIEDGAIRVQNDLIADIGKTAALKTKYPDDEEYDLTGRIVIPGLISTHMHTAQTLLRGAADDLELVSWLCERIWVLQGNFTAEDGYAAARLSIGEMLKSGTTCFLESMVCTIKKCHCIETDLIKVVRRPVRI